MAALLFTLLAACAEPALDVRRGERSAGLNGWFELEFDAPVRALSVSRRALVVRADDGRELDVALRVDDDLVTFALRVDAALLADPPREVVATLAGGASIHALSATDGRRLTSDRTVRWSLADAALTTSRAAGPEVVELGVGAGRVALVLDGVLDPRTLNGEARALARTVGDLALDPLPLGPLAWTVVGETSEVSFELPDVAPTARLQFDPRRVRWADVEGRRLRSSPPIDVEARASGS